MNEKKQLIYGCMGLGGGWNTDPITKEDVHKAERAIEAALEIGITAFDHADIYTLGKAEEVFGQVLQANPSLREKIKIQTKAGIQLHKGPNRSSIYNNSKEYMIQQVKASLARLKTDYLDSFLIHRPDPLMDGEEIAEAFHMLKEEGLVREFGVSNMSVAQMEYIQRFSNEPLRVNQLQLSLGHSLMFDLGVNVNTTNTPFDSGLQGMNEYCQQQNVTIQAWGSLDKGRFSGKPFESLTKEDQETAKRVKELADKYDVHESSIVLSWLLNLPVAVDPIIGTTNPERIRACKDALSVNLTRQEWYDLWVLARAAKLP